MKWRNSMHPFVLHASRCQSVCTADDEGGSETAHDVMIWFRSSRLSKLRDTQSRWWHIKELYTFLSHHRRKRNQSTCGKWEKCGTTGKWSPISFMDAGLQWKLKDKLVVKIEGNKGAEKILPTTEKEHFKIDVLSIKVRHTQSLGVFKPCCQAATTFIWHFQRL